MRICLVMLALSLALSASARDRSRLSAGAGPQQPITIEAHTIDGTATEAHAVGNVLFLQGLNRLTAEEVFYNIPERTGVMKNASFTTCDLEHPDYQIKAREIRLTPEQVLKLRHVSLYIGRFRLITLPRLRVNVGPEASDRAALPRLGYNNRDGVFTVMSRQLVQSDKTDVGLRLRPTTRAGIQGGLVGAYALEGTTRIVPPYVQDFDSELRRHQGVILPSIEDNVCFFRPTQVPVPILAVFGAGILKQRAYDLDVPGLQVTRLPEVGLRFISAQKCIVRENEQPDVGVQMEGRTSWGRIEENPGHGFLGRWDTRGTASTTLAKFGPSTALRGMGLARYSMYEDGEAYKALGAALDISRIFPGGSFGSLRMIGHTTSGTTPFQFDDIDITRELEAAGRYVRGRNTFGVLFSYDLEHTTLRDWEISYARKLHCIEPIISFRGRFSEFSLGVRVMGFQ